MFLRCCSQSPWVSRSYMPMNRKCSCCRQACWSRQRLLICQLCHSPSHVWCYKGRNFSGLESDHFCSVCIKSVLPFQSLSNDSFNKLYNVTIEDFLDQINELNAQNSDFDETTDNAALLFIIELQS